MQRNKKINLTLSVPSCRSEPLLSAPPLFLPSTGHRRADADAACSASASHHRATRCCMPWSRLSAPASRKTLLLRVGPLDSASSACEHPLSERPDVALGVHIDRRLEPYYAHATERSCIREHSHACRGTYKHMHRRERMHACYCSTAAVLTPLPPGAVACQNSSRVRASSATSHELQRRCWAAPLPRPHYRRRAVVLPLQHAQLRQAAVPLLGCRSSTDPGHDAPHHRWAPLQCLGAPAHWATSQTVIAWALDGLDVRVFGCMELRRADAMPLAHYRLGVTPAKHQPHLLYSNTIIITAPLLQNGQMTLHAETNH